MRKINPPLPLAKERRTARIGEEPDGLLVVAQDFKRLQRHLTKTALHPEAGCPETEIWFRFQLHLLVLEHLTNSDFFLASAQLQVRDILPALSHPFIYFPRLNTTIPIPIHKPTRLVIAQLLSSFSQDHGQMIDQALPLNEMEIGKSSEMQFALPGFRAFLKQQCQLAGLAPIKLKNLIAFSRRQALHKYGGYIAGYLDGTHIISPLCPIQHQDWLQEVRTQNEFRPIPVEIQPKVARGILSQSSTRKPLDPLYQEVRRIIKTKSSNLDKAKQCLMRILGALEDSSSMQQKNYKTGLKMILAGIKRSSSSLLPLWFCIKELITHYPYIPLHQLNYDQIMGFLITYENPNTRSAYASHITALHFYLMSEFGEVAFPPHSKKEFYYLTEKILPTLKQIESLTGTLMAHGHNATQAGISALLGAFGGMRIEKTMDIKLCHVTFSANRIVISVSSPKHSPHRWVRLIDLPDGVYELLYKHWQTVKSHSKSGGALWLQSSTGQAIKPERIRYLITKFGKLIDWPGATHRALRAFSINRLLARGHELIDIALLAGHASAETTVTKYSCIPALLLIKKIIVEDDLHMNVARLGPLLGLSNRAVRRIHMEQAGIAFVGDGRNLKITLDDALAYLAQQFS